MYASGYFPSRGAVKGWFADLALPASGVGTGRAAFLCYRFSSLNFFVGRCKFCMVPAVYII